MIKNLSAQMLAGRDVLSVSVIVPCSVVIQTQDSKTPVKTGAFALSGCGVHNVP